MSGSIGLVINPIAGMGGPAGLKGSDGSDVQSAARALGSESRAEQRAIRALGVVAAAHPGIEVITADGVMGADAARASGLRARVVFTPATPSTGADTVSAAEAIAHAGATLLLFVGGDGTARDVATALSPERAVLGVPAGVKMYSGCFAVSPSSAGALAARWAAGDAVPLEPREVLDVDEHQIRDGRVDPRLFALVQVPFVVGRTQSRKSATAVSETAAVESAAGGVVALMDPITRYLIGPGGTTMEIARQLDVPKTPLGVDVVQDGQVLLADASERQLLTLLAGSSGPAKAIVTIIGGQGFLLGRGNQQLSASVLTALGPDPLIVVATEEKLLGLGGRPLIVDTGDPVADRGLAGYIRVITGMHNAGMYRVEAPEIRASENRTPENIGAQRCG